MLGLRLLTLPPDAFLALLIGHVVKNQSPATQMGMDSSVDKGVAGVEGGEF